MAKDLAEFWVNNKIWLSKDLASPDLLILQVKILKANYLKVCPQHVAVAVKTGF